MNEIKINKNSWHYRFTKEWNHFRLMDVDDICKYRSAFLFAILQFVAASLFFLFATTVLSVGMVHMSLSLLSPLLWGQFIVSEEASVMYVVTFIAAIIIFVGYFFDGIPSRANRIVESEMFRSWKEKYCKKVSFE